MKIFLGLNHKSWTMVSIPSVQLNNDISIPSLGLGTWNLRGATLKQAVIWAIDIGYRHFDTATRDENELELVCTNRYCYVNYRNQKVIQIISEDEEPLCENCGFKLEPWKDVT